MGEGGGGKKIHIHYTGDLRCGQVRHTFNVRYLNVINKSALGVHLNSILMVLF